MKRDAQTAILQASARFIRRQIGPLVDRIKGLEDRSLPVDKLLDSVHVRGAIEGMVVSHVGAIPAPEVRHGRDGRDGKSITADDVAPLIDSLVAKAVAEIPAPKDGERGERGPGPTAEELDAAAARYFAANPPPKGDKGEQGKEGQAGKDADPIDVKEVVAELLGGDEIKTLVDLHVAEALPATVVKHFESNPVQHGKDGAPGKAGEPGAPGDPGKDGKSVTLEDVTLFLDAAIAKHVLDLERRANDAVSKAIDKIPVPINGKDGRDGVAPFDIEWDGQRTFTVKSGDAVVKTYKLAVPLDAGYWREDKACEAGDVVTHDGNAWIAQRDTKAKPCRESADWRMLARRGRDGRDGIDAKPAPGPVKLTGSGNA